MTAITAITSQNTLGVRSIHSVPLDILRDQIDAVVEDIGVDAVKIGMLHSRGHRARSGRALQRHQLRTVVLDPVMIATSGAVLIDDEAVDVLVRELFRSPRSSRPTSTRRPCWPAALAAKATWNRPRASCWTWAPRRPAQGRPPERRHGERPAAAAARRTVWLRAPRIASGNTHGTGCTLSSAIASHLALGADLTQAVRQSRDFVRSALQAGARVRTGAGSGPLNHGFAPHAMQLRPLP